MFSASVDQDHSALGLLIFILTESMEPLTSLNQKIFFLIKKIYFDYLEF